MFKKIITNIRLKIVVSVRLFSYSDSIMQGILKSYLGHNKIIHFQNNLPVVSLLTPPLFSKPSANFFSKLFQGVIQNRTFPFFVSLAVSDTCNVSCSHCSFYSSAKKQVRHLLTIEECKKSIADAQTLGATVIAFVGGEPLLRDGFEEIIQSVDKNLSVTTVFTNGWFLKEKAQKLRSAGLNNVYVSIDSSNKDKHDEIRGKKGLFEKAIRGIKAAKECGLTVGISCCISKEDFASGELNRIIELGKKIGVHEIMIFDKIPTGRLGNCEELVDNNWGNIIVSSVEKYNNDQSYPGIVSYAYTSNYQGYGCIGGTRYLYISPYGDIAPCDFNHATFGNLLEEPLYAIWDRMSSLKEFRQATWGGCKLKNSRYRNNPNIVKSSF